MAQGGLKVKVKVGVTSVEGSLFSSIFYYKEKRSAKNKIEYKLTKLIFQINDMSVKDKTYQHHPNLC